MSALYDWERLKIEYFEAPEIEIRAFLRRRLGEDFDNDGGPGRKTVGWREEKKMFIREKFEAAKSAAKLKNPLPIEAAIESTLKGLGEVVSRLSDAESLSRMTVDEIEKAIKLIYNMLGEKYGYTESEITANINIENVNILQNIINDIRSIQQRRDTGNPEPLPIIQTTGDHLPGDAGPSTNN